MNKQQTDMKKMLAFLLTILVTSAGLNAQNSAVASGDTGIEHIVVNRSPEFGFSLAKTKPGYLAEQISDRVVRYTGPEELVPITKEHPFVAVGLTWKGRVSNDHQIAIEIRGSANTRDWSEWMMVDVDHHVDFEDGRIGGVLVFFPAGTQYIQYRATLNAEMMQLQPTLDEISFHFINPGVTPEADLAAHKSTVVPYVEVKDRLQESRSSEKSNSEGVSGQINSFDLPVYVPRTSWGASLNLTNTASRSATNVTHMFVHHSAGQTNSADFAAVVRSYHILHTQTNGWADIGYNWLVDGNGVIYQGRAFATNGFMDVIGAHTGGSNTNSMGVCVIGHYSTVMPTNNAINSLMRMLAWKANEKNIDVRVRNIHPFTGRNYFTISGHRDGSATECPGQRLYNYLPTLRSRTHAFLNPPEIVVMSAEDTTAVTTRFIAEIGIRNFETNVEVFVEYGTDAEDLSMYTEEIAIVASDNVETFDLELVNLMPATNYYYRVVAVNSDTSAVSQVYSFTTASPTSIEGNESPNSFVLEQNYPNPFNPSTSISFELQQAANVRVLVYNSQGQMIAVPAERSYSSGRHSVTFDASNVASGVLVYALEVDGVVVQTRKMLLLR
jgi:hypothetical protein